MVLCILVETTVPDKILPLMETVPTNGHFLSMYEPLMAADGVLKPNPTSLYHLLAFLLALAFGLVKMCCCYSKELV